MKEDASTKESWVHTVKGTEGHWRGLDELTDDPETKNALKAEILQRFPAHFLSRREFMGWMGALSALLGTSACTRQPLEKILPYKEQPEGVIPGKPLYYASAYVHGGDVQGVLVESHMGRPTKIDGNAAHPASLGATDRFAQAAILDLYDPDRCKSILHRGVATDWKSFAKAVGQLLKAQEAKKGAGVRILSEPIFSPSLGAQLKDFLSLYPEAKWFRHDAVDWGTSLEGTELAFGKALTPQYRMKEADVVLSFDADFMEVGPGHVRYSRDFSARRRSKLGQDRFNRLYMFECSPTITGSVADHRWAVHPELLRGIALEIARLVGVGGIEAQPLDYKWATLAELIAGDLSAKKGSALVVPGSFQSAELQSIAHAMNSALGAIGKTVVYTNPAEEGVGTFSRSVSELVAEMNAGKVDLLVTMGGNPAVQIPGFKKALGKVSQTINFSPYYNETGRASVWQVPQAHFLESWGDARAFDGTASVVQPLIRPLYQGKAPQQLASALLGKSSDSAYDVVRAHWKKRFASNFEKTWRKAIHDGVFQGTAFSPQSVRWSGRSFQRSNKFKQNSLSLAVRPDPCVWDGRYANNAWLQELPKPLTKVTWENVFQVDPVTAGDKGIANGRMVEVSIGDRKVSGPAWIVPGQPRGVLTVHLGYGRTQAGRVGNGYGFDVYGLQNGEAWSFNQVKLTPGSGITKIACTQSHFEMEGRDLVRHASVKQFKDHPDMFKSAHHGGGHHGAHGSEHHGEKHHGKEEQTPFEDPNYAWGMTIDLSACNGCNACVVACQSENNIAVVGKEQVLMGREMHWLRLDRYYEGNPAEPTAVHHQPVPCMHCEKAPCEVVCPVNATSHSPSGLNEMTYNRCVGTKYCANNCPYKVRRFNFYHYSDVDTPSLQIGRNPDVTVRSRGVMEKCTYCVQRINEARITAKKENRIIRDGEVVTACQTVCPTEAIEFGNMKDGESRVSKLKAKSSNYGLLEELGTVPRTSYLAKLTNPNPKVEAFLKKGRGSE